MNPALIFFEVVLAMETMYEPQFNLEEKDSPSILKYGFFSKTGPFIFTWISPELLDQSNEASWVFPALK